MYIKLDQIGSNWIKLDQNWIKSDQIRSNFEKAILKKHAVKKHVLKKHALKKLFLENKHDLENITLKNMLL